MNEDELMLRSEILGLKIRMAKLEEYVLRDKTNLDVFYKDVENTIKMIGIDVGKIKKAFLELNGTKI